MKRNAHSNWEQIKQSSADLFLCAYAPLERMSEFSDGSWGYVLFDHEYHLLKLFGHPDFIVNCKQHNILAGTSWDPENHVPNAFEKCISTGAASASREGPLSYYASPLTLDSERVETAFLNYRILPVRKDSEPLYPRKMICLFGCIGIIDFSKSEQQNNLLKALTENAAREVSLQLHWFCVGFNDVTDNTFSISIDHSYGRQQITLLSKNVSDYFGLPKDRSYRSQPLSLIIDPEPENTEFWHIVNTRKIVNNYPITVSGNGHKIRAKIATSRSIEPRFLMVEYVISFWVDSSSQVRGKKKKYAAFSDIIAVDKSFQNQLNYAAQIGESDSTVLITGESGVGKDIMAQAIHSASKRASGPFIVVNCAAIPKDLISSELFGYEAGAFTGAKKTGAKGKFEAANNGTIFLDEIGDMPLELQGHFLRAIEQKRFTRVGGSEEITVDVRIIAATNVNLIEKIRARTFREDLYYRLNVFNIAIPPLRSRPNDILPLTDHFLKKYCLKYNKPMVYLDDEVRIKLLTYSWPGNIRELQSVCERIASLGNTQYLQENLFKIETSESILHPGPETEIQFQTHTDDQKKRLSFRSHAMDSDVIRRALENNKYNVSRTAKELGISRCTLYRRLREYGFME